MADFTIRPLTDADRSWVTSYLKEEWIGPAVVSRGRLHQADTLPGFMAEWDGEPVGLVTYRIEANQCELVTLNSLEEGKGIGVALLQAVAAAAREAGCTRLWLITTNDNTPALRFYQKQGMRLVAVYPNAIEASRKLKHGIPRTGWDGIPIRDELELEMDL